MIIKRITTQAEFTVAVSFDTLAVWSFGPLGNLPRMAGDDEADEDDLVLLAQIDGATVGYLTADRSGVWCIEVAPEHRGKGVAKALVKESGATFFNACTEAGAALADALGMEWEGWEQP